MEKSPIYSPKQVLVGSFLGGPIALVYFLRTNFQTLGNAPAATQTIIWGVLFNLVVIATIPFLPRNFPRYLLPLAYSWTAWGIAEAKQLKRESIAASAQFRFHSNWRVFGLAVAFLVGTFVLWFAILVSLAAVNGKQPAGNFAISDKELIVRGWSEAELRQIIGDFQQMYRDRLPASFSTEIHAGDSGVLRVTFPADIAPELFCWLINYVQYPKSFDLKSRTILVAGRAIMSSDFLPSEQSLVGRRVTFYIPANDKRYDEVFAQVDGQSYEYPFTSERWRPAQAPRLPVGVSDLK